MSLLLMKFGGTSVGSAERIRQSAEIVREARHEHSVVVVVSALSGVTDQIIEAVSAACAGEGKTLEDRLATLEQRHREVVEALFAGEKREAVMAGAGEALRELRDVCGALLMLRAATPQVLDVVLAIGERMSAPIFAAQLCELKLDARPFDSLQFLITNDDFGDASPDMEATTQRSRECLLPAVSAGAVPVVTGYRGGTIAGQPTTLGRGGSDYSATILGAALRCDEIWIWTDVDGVMSADPRICPGATILPEITFAEAIEMSYYGAKVIHRKAVRPAYRARHSRC